MGQFIACIIFLLALGSRVKSQQSASVLSEIPNILWYVCERGECTCAAGQEATMSLVEH